ncbi:MAG: hypothetical protein QXO47_07045 [Thermoproteota archaeon]|nr:hypothetical protein [Candidatus Brockarchaeota archaeon]
MTEYRIWLSFSKDTPSEIVKKIYNEFSETRAYRINTLDFIAMRTKLIYIPVIMATAVYGLPNVEHGKLPRLSFAWNLYTESESYFSSVFTWRWSDEDQNAYEMLSNRVSVKVDRIYWEGRWGRKHVIWPVTVFDLKEVREEIERIRSGPLFLPDDPYDRKLMDKYSRRSNVEEKGEEMMRSLVIEEDGFIRGVMLRLYDVLMKTRNEVKSVFWFSFYYPG